jgi:ferric-dicitrate binding protein FerR (iron transport regulator)
MKCPVIVGSLLLALATAAPSADAMSAPCGSVELRRGTVIVGQPILVGKTLPQSSKVCLKHIAGLLAHRSSIRTVTVAIRLPDRRRASAASKQLTADVRRLMIESGISSRLLSTVVPAAQSGEAAAVHVTYRETRSSRAVALITSITGVVKKGRYRGKMSSSAKGSRLVAYEYIQTPDANSSARLVLADGSEIRVYPRTLLRIGPVVLNAKLKRRVSIDLLAGSIKTHAQYGGRGSQFDVKTRTAVAGVRGTDFRVAVAGGFTRVETTGGAVELAGSKSAVAVNGGLGSRVDGSGVPEKARQLLAGPLGLRPVAGTVPVGSSLSWRVVPNASAYKLELASDAYFTQRFQVHSIGRNSWSVPTVLSGAKWFWRVQAVDRDGFVGMPSKVYAFTAQ